jgi:hypothetical protein
MLSSGDLPQQFVAIEDSDLSSFWLTDQSQATEATPAATLITNDTNTDNDNSIMMRYPSFNSDPSNHNLSQLTMVVDPLIGLSSPSSHHNITDDTNSLSNIIKLPACQICFSHKVKCDGMRPCQRYHLSSHSYTYIRATFLIRWSSTFCYSISMLYSYVM